MRQASNTTDTVPVLSGGELAYLAGVIDGEGSFVISRSHHPDCKGPVFVPFMAVSNTSYKLISWVRGRIGGSLVTRKKDQRWRTCYQIQVYPKKLVELLPKIIPFLVVKQDQAKTMLRFLGTTKHGAAAYHLSPQERRIRSNLYKRMKVLNHPDDTGS